MARIRKRIVFSHANAGRRINREHRKAGGVDYYYPYLIALLRDQSLIIDPAKGRSRCSGPKCAAGSGSGQPTAPHARPSCQATAVGTDRHGAARPGGAGALSAGTQPRPGPPAAHYRRTGAAAGAHPPLTPIERRVFDHSDLDHSMAHMDQTIRHRRALRDLAKPIIATVVTANGREALIRTICPEHAFVARLGAMNSCSRRAMDCRTLPRLEGRAGREA